MSPLDDELRTALHGRARSVSPSPDPLAGIERRASAIRRRRTAASVAGSALAVAAIALAVPALAPSTDGPAPQVATSTAPTPAPPPTAAVTTDAQALDPQDPWPYRGISLADLGEGTIATVTREYATVRGVDEAAVRLSPLFGQVHEPSQATELVFLATVDGEHRWGVVASSEGGPEFRVDEALPSPALALAAALPGDEVVRLLVVTAPGAGEVQYGPDDASEFAALTEIADGVWTGPLEGEAASDSYRLLDAAGSELVREPAPDLVTPTPEEPASAPPVGVAPDNLLTWPSRGEASAELQERALAAFAQALGAARRDVDGRLLFGGGDDTGRSYVFLQAWQRGQDARTAGLVTGGGLPDQPFLGPVLDKGPALLAFVVPAGAGRSTDTLVVVPEPGTGQVLYAPDATSEPAPVGTEQDGVWLVDRSPRPADDQLLVLDGDGDLDAPVFRGSVAPLLCGATGCG